MSPSTVRPERLALLMLLALAAPAAARGQIPVFPGLADTVVLRETDDDYLLDTVLVGVPSLVISAANLTHVPIGGVGLGMLGIGLGIAHGSLLARGLREDDAQGAVTTWNGLAMAFSTFAGIVQIRSSLRDPPSTDDAVGQDDAGRDRPAALAASIFPVVQGAQLVVTWTPSR